MFILPFPHSYLPFYYFFFSQNNNSKLFRMQMKWREKKTLLFLFCNITINLSTFSQLLNKQPQDLWWKMIDSCYSCPFLLFSSSRLKEKLAKLSSERPFRASFFLIQRAILWVACSLSVSLRIESINYLFIHSFIHSLNWSIIFFSSKRE